MSTLPYVDEEHKNWSLYALTPREYLLNSWTKTPRWLLMGIHHADYISGFDMCIFEAKKIIIGHCPHKKNDMKRSFTLNRHCTQTSKNWGRRTQCLWKEQEQKNCIRWTLFLWKTCDLKENIIVWSGRWCFLKVGFDVIRQFKQESTTPK
jgi:hypothetical protein